MSINLLAVLGAMLTIATPLVWAGIGEQVVEKTGVLNLGIEGTMYAGAFTGFLVPGETVTYPDLGTSSTWISNTAGTKYVWSGLFDH